MPKNWSLLRAVGLLSAVSLAVLACGGATSTQGGKLASDQTLRFPLGDDFGTLDPGMADQETEQEIGQNVFNGLVKFDNQLNVVPDIAQSVPSASSDGLTYVFKLRHDVTFSNGDKVTAKDVLYSWNRAAALQGPYSTNQSAIAGFDKVTAANITDQAKLEDLLAKNDPSVMMSGLTAPDGPDGYTVQVKLAQPAGWFLSAIALSDSTGMIVDEKAIKTDPANWWSNPQTLIGTGAYRMTARTAKQSSDFEAVPNWWGSPKPTVKHVHMDVIQDPTTQITAYEQGKYDIVGYGGYSGLPVADVLRIKNDPKESKQLLLQPKVRSYWVSFNMTADSKRKVGGPFTLDQPGSKDLRTAFSLAVDKKKLVDVVCHSLLCTPATGGLFPPGLKGYLGAGKDPLAAFDSQKAKDLLKKADPDGSKTKGLTYYYDPNNALNKPTADFLQDQWQTNLGVHVDLQPESHTQFIKDRRVGDFVLSRDGWQADYNHPQDWFDNLWGKLAGCPDSCSSGYDTAAYDQLLGKADSAPLDQAMPMYKQLHQMLIDDAVYIPLYYQVGAFLFKPYLQGAGSNNFFDNYWNQIKVMEH